MPNSVISLEITIFYLTYIFQIYFYKHNLYNQIFINNFLIFEQFFRNWFEYIFYPSLV